MCLWLPFILQDAKQRAFEFESPKHFIRTYILPKLVLVNSMIERFVSNFVMLKYRQALMNQPGPYVPPRFRLMVQSPVFREKGLIFPTYLFFYWKPQNRYFGKQCRP